MARAVPDERDRILVKLCLPRDALIELVIRCWLGLGVESVLPGIRHLPQRWATSRHQRRWRCRLAQMREDLAHGHGVVDESDDAHLGATSRQMAAMESEHAAWKRGLAVPAMTAPGRPRPSSKGSTRRTMPSISVESRSENSERNTKLRWGYAGSKRSCLRGT